ncbi:MAG TPA: hypothetical protein VFV87_17605, partial [Pirellulaceae bacterium]|nr:hypothetical protein [Pirellulaceae bacterium]
MNVFRSSQFALGLIIAAALALAGCAAGRGARAQRSDGSAPPVPAIYGREESRKSADGLAARTVVPPAIAASQRMPPPPQDAPPGAVQPAAFHAALVEPAVDLVQPPARPPAQQPAATPAEPLPIAPAAPTAERLPAERPTVPIDLATALALTHGQNPRIAFAQAQIAQSLAQYDAARVLWLPSLRAGMNYNK